MSHIDVVLNGLLTVSYTVTRLSTGNRLLDDMQGIEHIDAASVKAGQAFLHFVVYFIRFAPVL
jgi:hypothetical protein